jgi:phytoene synthase
VTPLSYSAEQVRQYDHDRFLTTIFAPPSVRENLYALYAFNLEIAKVREVVTEPLIGHMRLQWWRDTLDRLYAGETVAHAVAEPLGKAIATGRLGREHFDRLIDTREADLDSAPIGDMKTLIEYAEGTSAPLLALALAAGGGQGEAAQNVARLAGTGWALTGLLRAVPFHARQRRLYLPVDRLDAAGVRTGRLLDLKPEAGLNLVVREIAEQADGLFAGARRLIRHLPKDERSPALLIELGRFRLNDLKRADWNPFALESRPQGGLIALKLGLRSVLGGY